MGDQMMMSFVQNQNLEIPEPLGKGNFFFILDKMQVKVFSYFMRINIGHNIRVATLVSLKRQTAAMLVSSSNPLGIELHSYANVFFCFG